ncbi:MAG: ComEC/Rec2 family competence protein [Alphaproteobacteria bacterium]|nr:ComEC/Rec2 family competence protein [Alphaproteobacteria bacterium]
MQDFKADNSNTFALLAFIGGAAAFFAMPIDPPFWALAALAAGVFAAWYKHRTLVPILAAFSIGFVMVWARAGAIDFPRIQEPIEKTWLEGKVLEAVPFGAMTMLTLEPTFIRAYRGKDEPLPRKLVIWGRGNGFIPGQHIAMFAQLNPIGPPAVPGYNDRRAADWFRSIGGRGQALSRARITDGSQASFWEGLRNKIRLRIFEVLPKEQAGIVTALSIGWQGFIPRSVRQDYRNSGISHVLSISGLHMVLLAGTVFFLVRKPLNMFGRFDAMDTKKYAAMAALAAMTGYLMISGMSVPAVRSFIMAAIALLAMMINRRTVSKQLLALAAVLIIIYDPPSMLSPVFQLSFTAVLALITLFEQVDFTRFNRWAAVALTVLGVNVAAMLATLPIIMYHFGQVSTLDVLANFAISPLFGIWIMPMVFLGLATMPLGFDLPLKLAGAGTSIMTWVAGTAASMPWAVFPTSAMPGWGLVLAMASVLIISLVRGRIRFIAVGIWVMAVLSPMTVSLPDIYAVPGLAAARNADGLCFSDARKKVSVRREWLKHAGFNGHKSVRCKETLDIDVDQPTLIWLDPPRIKTDECKRVWCG